MSDYFLGEIRLFPYPAYRVPQGWHACDGSLLSIRQYTALYSLIGTQFGGDGQNTFALPDLRGRVPVGVQYVAPLQAGNINGTEMVALTTNQIPAHTHTLSAEAGPGNSIAPTTTVGTTKVPNHLAGAAADFQVPPQTHNITGPLNDPPSAALAASTLSHVGGAPHNNMQPSLVLNYCIATVGIYPMRQ